MKNIIFTVLMLYSINTFAGEWIADSKTGCKVYNPHPAEGESINWSGSCKNKKAHGKGILQWFLNGHVEEKYEGEYRDGHMHGKGIYVDASSARYEGDWKDGKYNGKGIYVDASGARYEGDWKDGKYNGKGIYVDAGGERYEGDWKDGKYNGKGIKVDAGGERYEGDWKDGKYNGKGIKVWGGDRYEGDWKDGKMTGYGSYDFSNGSHYYGMWLDNNRNGEGTNCDRYGDCTKGYYENDRRIRDIYDSPSNSTSSSSSSSGSPELCEIAYRKAGKYYDGLCFNHPRSKEKWTCMIEQMNKGNSMFYAESYCGT